MPTKWLQERHNGSKNDTVMHPRRALRGFRRFVAHRLYIHKGVPAENLGSHVELKPSVLMGNSMANGAPSFAQAALSKEFCWFTSCIVESFRSRGSFISSPLWTPQVYGPTS